MAVKAGSFTPLGTGNLSVDNLPFLPTRIFLRIGSTSGSPDTSRIARSDGWATSSNQSHDSFFHDTTGTWQDGSTTKCLHLVYRSGGVITDAVIATFVNFHTNSPTNYGFTLNFPTNIGGKQIRYMLDDA